MERFSLDIWLKDKNRKVVTRDGRPVRIVCWDLKCNTPIIAAIQWNQEREDCYCYDAAGRCANNVGELDLFFVDEELTEFEKELVNLVSGWCDSHIETPEEYISEHSRKLLELARKEIGSKSDKNLADEEEELKKIEQKPVDLPKGEDYGIDGMYTALDILQKTLGEVDGYQSDDGILEHKCAINAIKKLYEQNPAWSEEDEKNCQMLQKIICDSDITAKLANKLSDWLKSIKPQKHWKPSDEQLNEVKEAIGVTGTNGIILLSLYNDLLKL